MINMSKNHINNLWQTTVETIVYTCLAAVLISQIFFINNTIQYTDVVLVMLGVLFAILAAYRLTPITNRMSGKDVAIPADILIYSNNKLAHHTPSFREDNQRAA
jgi:hypothetical protein